MIDREDIARRHGLSPYIAADLHGETQAECEADAAARAAIASMFTPRDMGAEPAHVPEPEVEGLAPKDKDVADHSEAEHAASHANLMRSMRERERREGQAAAQVEADANRTPDQRFGDAITEALNGQAAADAALIRSIHGGTEGES